jgi:lipopolysaccharide biosynthesis glycosyltransferase
MGIAKEIAQKDNITVEEATVIHYTARRKPWLHLEALHRIKQDAAYFTVFRYWQEEWMELMEELHQLSSH